MNLKEIEPFCDHSIGFQNLYNRVLQKALTLPEEFPFLEIGIRLGGSSLLFLNAIKDSGRTKRFLFTVDPYGAYPYTSRADDYGENFRRLSMKQITDYCFENNLNHSHFRLKSLDFFNTWMQSSFYSEGKEFQKAFSFIYFDGDHEDQTVFKEVELFGPQVCSNGLFVIDDQLDIDHYASVTNIIPECDPETNRLFFDLEK